MVHLTPFYVLFALQQLSLVNFIQKHGVDFYKHFNDTSLDNLFFLS